MEPVDVASLPPFTNQVRTALWLAAFLVIAGTMPTRVHACSVLSDRGCPAHNVWVGTLTTTDGVVRRVRFVFTRQFHYGTTGYFLCFGGWCPSRRGRAFGGIPDENSLGLGFRDVNKTGYSCDVHYLLPVHPDRHGGSCDLFENGQLVRQSAAQVMVRLVGH